MFAVLFFTINATAAIYYVKDIEEITLREEPKIGRNVILMINSGQRVEILGSSGNWSRIRLPDGDTGWVLSRFLTTDIPNKYKLEQLQMKHQNLSEESEQLKRQNEDLRAEIDAATAELAKNSEKYQKLKESYETLKTECGDFLQLQADFDMLSMEYNRLKQKSETLNIEILELAKQLGLAFYLSGAGVLLIGIWIGLWAKRRQKRSSYL